MPVLSLKHAMKAYWVQELIPPSRWYIEALHLRINTGNCWVEVACNTLQYLMNPDGTVRDRVQHPPGTWALAGSGSRQKQEWRGAGFDLEDHICTVLGDNLNRPITKWHGAQIEAIFKQHDKLWQAEPLGSGL
jgi:hypothetical protein